MADEPRIEELQSEIAHLKERLAAIESRLGNPSPPPPAVPQQYPRPSAPTYSPPPPPPTQYPSWMVDRPLRPTATQFRGPQDKTASADAEYQIGAKVLPRVGAVVFLLGVVYLVALAISRHYITPTMQFVGEQVLCAGFVVFGLIKRNEKEDFGQILVGIGSCGFYLSFAGAFAYKHLITDEQLVGLFALLSLLNLTFSGWRSSRSFLAIGVLGGFVAAVLPYDKNAMLSGDLQVAITLVAAAIVGRNKWVGEGIALYVASLIASLITKDAAWRSHFLPDVPFLYINGFIAVAGLAIARQSSDADTPSGLITGCTFLTAAIAFVWWYGHEAAYLVCAYAAAIVLLAFALRKDPVKRDRLILGAALSVVVLVPAAWREYTLPAYCGLAIMFAIASRFRPGLTTLGLSVVSTIAANVSYAALNVFDEGWRQELWKIALLCAAIGAGAVAARGRREVSFQSMRREVLAVGALAIDVWLLRAGYLVSFQIDPLHRTYIALIASALAISAINTLTSIIRRSAPLSVLGWLLMLFGGIAYAAILASGSEYFSNVHLYLGEDLVVLASFVVLTLTLTYSSIRVGSSRDGMYLLAGAILWFLFSRLGFLILTLPSIGMKEAAAISLAWTLYAFGLIVAGFAWKQPFLRYMSFALFACTLCKVLAYDLSELDSGIRVAVLMALGFAMLMGGYWYIKVRGLGAKS